MAPPLPYTVALPKKKKKKKKKKERGYASVGKQNSVKRI